MEDEAGYRPYSVSMPWPPSGEPSHELTFEFAAVDGELVWTGFSARSSGLQGFLHERPAALSPGLVKGIPFGRESAHARRVAERLAAAPAPPEEPSRAGKRGRGAPVRLDDAFYREVARVYKKAEFLRQPPGLAVQAWAEKARGRSVTRTAVANWIKQARARKLLDPYPRQNS